MGTYSQDYIRRLRNMPVLLKNGKTVTRHLYLISWCEAFICINKGLSKVVKTTNGGQWVEVEWIAADDDIASEPRWQEFAMFRVKGGER